MRPELDGCGLNWVSLGTMMSSDIICPYAKEKVPGCLTANGWQLGRLEGHACVAFNTEDVESSEKVQQPWQVLRDGCRNPAALWRGISRRGISQKTKGSVI